MQNNLSSVSRKIDSIEKDSVKLGKVGRGGRKPNPMLRFFCFHFHLIFDFRWGECAGAHRHDERKKTNGKEKRKWEKRKEIRWKVTFPTWLVNRRSKTNQKLYFNINCLFICWLFQKHGSWLAVNEALQPIRIRLLSRSKTRWILVEKAVNEKVGGAPETSKLGKIGVKFNGVEPSPP